MLKQRQFKTTKISGTTFQKVSDTQLKLDPTQPVQFYNGWINADKTNPYDPNAQVVSIFVPNTTGQNDDQYVIGYVPKNSSLYQTLNDNHIDGKTCRIRISYLKDAGLNNRFTLMYH